MQPSRRPRILTIFCGSCRSRATRPSVASMFRSVRPDRNGSPAAKRWAKPTPRKPSSNASKGRFVERKPKENRKISLRIDLENSIKAQQSAGYEKWAKLHNLKQAARTLNFLTEHEIESYPDLESRVAEITAASTEAAAALKAAERRLAENGRADKGCHHL